MASSVLARGNAFRLTMGSVNAVKFFVTLTASIVLLLTLGISHLGIVAGLAFGGVASAPLGAGLVKHVRPQPMLVLMFVGILAMALSVRTALKHFGMNR